MKNPITKFASAATVLILISIGLYNLTGPGINTAFANAMEHFVASQTARFDLSIELGDQQPKTSSFFFDAKGYIRQNMTNGNINIVDYTENKVLSLDPQNMIAVLRDVKKPDFHTSLYNIFTKLQDLLQQAIDLGHGPVETLGTKIIDGKTAYGYRTETTGQSPGIYWQGKGTLTIWADAKTDFPLILEWHQTMTNIKTTVSNISLNIYIDPAEFNLDVPEGYSFQQLPKAAESKCRLKESVEPPEPNEASPKHEDIIEPDGIPELKPEQTKTDLIIDHNIADLIDGLDKTEQSLIKYFHSWASLDKGKFPSSLTVDAIKDIDPNAKINFDAKLWSPKFSVMLPNLFGVWEPGIDPNDYTKEEIQQAEAKQGPYYQELHKRVQEHMQIYKPLLKDIIKGFVMVNELPAKSDWHYNGQEATLGDTDTAIFWYKPKDSKTYRVIYGDLTIEDIPPEYLHLLENLPDDEIDRQATAVLEAAIQLGADIPEDDRNKVLRMLSLKEKDLIKGLATYLEYSDGRYPSSMILDKSFIQDIDALFSEAINQGHIDKEASEAKVFDLFYAGSFYAKLTREKKESTYYGSTATLSDPNAILVRWKISKNKYRVIYTSLKAETVTAQRLAELEKTSIPIQ